MVAKLEGHYILGGMSKKATSIILKAEEERALEQLVHSAKTEQRLVLRSRIIQLYAGGMTARAIVRELDVRPATVSR